MPGEWTIRPAGGPLISSLPADTDNSGLPAEFASVTVDLPERGWPSGMLLPRSIHARYVRPEGLAQPEVARYLSEGDDVTIRMSMDTLVTWNNAGSPAGRALLESGQVHPLDG